MAASAITSVPSSSYASIFRTQSLRPIVHTVPSSSSASSSSRRWCGGVGAERRSFRHASSRNGGGVALCCLYSNSPSSSSSESSTDSRPKTRIYVSGLSFRTTEESLRNAFQKFGDLVDVNLVMDNVANRPRGFAFLRYATEDESQSAIEGMHGKFLDGRVIFVEVAKPRLGFRKASKQNPARTS